MLVRKMAATDMHRLVGFSFMFAPLLHEPPDWPLPDAVLNPQWYGEVWLKYPASDRRYPSCFGQIFEARSRFRVIMNRACQVAYSEDSEMTLNDASTLMLQLKIWYGSLPRALHPDSIVLPGQLQLQ